MSEKLKKITALMLVAALALAFALPAMAENGGETPAPDAESTPAPEGTPAPEETKEPESTPVPTIPVSDEKPNTDIVVIPSNANALVLMDVGAQSPKGEPGDVVTIVLPVAVNREYLPSERYMLRNITVSPKIPKDASVSSWPFDLINASYTRHLDDMSYNSTAEIYYDFRISEFATKGVYPVNFEVNATVWRYDDVNGTSITEDVTFNLCVYVTLMGNGSESGVTTNFGPLQIAAANQSGVFEFPILKLKQTVTLRVPIVNKGGELKNVTISPVISNSLDEFPFIAENVNYGRYFESWATGMMAYVEYNFTVSYYATNGNKPVKFLATYYENGKPQQCTFSTYVDGFSNNKKNAIIRNKAANNETWSITIEWNGAEGTKTTVANVNFTPGNDYVNDSGLYLKRDGITYYYKVKLVKYDTATLSLISAARTGEDSATIMFSSTAAGTAYSYAVVDKGAAAPAAGDYSAPVETAFAANAAVTLSLTGLTAGEKDVYLKATDANGISTKTLTVPLGNAATWPQLAALKLDPLPEITQWNKLPDYDGKIVGYKIEQHDTLQPVCSHLTKSTANKTCYEAGVITMYLDKLPTENEAGKTDETTAIYFKYALPADCAEIAWNNCTPHASDSETISGKNVTQRKKMQWCNNASGMLYLRTADDVYYYYRMAAEVYSIGDEVKLKNGSAVRTSSATATVTFSSSKAGKFYYIVSDTQLESPVDITANETEMLQGVNTFEISGLADSAAKYVYIIGKNGNAQSEVLEIIVPGMLYKLNHEVQALEGFLLVDTWENGNVLGGDFYTEKFTDANGKEITTATPGDIVTVTFEANGGRMQKPITDTVGNKIVGVCNEYQLQSWTIDGADITPAPTGTTFTFTMPESDVTVQAVVAAVGVPAKMSTNLQLTGTVSIGYYNTKYSSWSTTDMLRPGELERSHTYKLGLTLRMDEKYKPGYEVNNTYILDRIEVYNNGTLLTPTEDELYTTGITLAEGDDYEFRFVFRAKAFSQITVGANDAQMGSATLSVNGGAAAETAIAYANDTVTLTAAPGERYMLTGWKVEDIDGTAIDIEASELIATFTVPSTGKAITATALFDIDPEKASAQNALISAALYGEDGALIAAADRDGTRFEITLPDGYNVADLAERAKLVLDYSPYATARLKGADSDWPAEGQGGMTVGTEYTFVITAENKRDAQEYTVVIIAPKSSNNTMTKVELLATADKAVIAEGTLEGDTWTITITDKTVADNLTMQYLRLTYDEKATVAMAGGYDDATGDFKWRNGDVMCGMSVNQPVKFTVTAENGDTKEYTIVVKYDAPAAPELSNGSAERASDKEATVKFTSSEAGTYYYAVVNKGATTPTVDTTKNGKNAVAGENVITLNNLTAGAREIYIIVKNASGVESAVLKIDIPAFDGSTEQPGEFKISISAPKGGTLTASKTTANAGDVITVTATPDAGMQMVAGSLTYTLAVAGGETKKIDNFTFTMPAGDVSLTCKWETKSTTVSGITSFNINGVLGSINHTNGTISVVMPYGTDVSKLVPVISGNNITDITPGSGVMQDFSKPVTYTVTLTDGTVKTYTATVYVQSGTQADQMWEKLTDFYNQVPWWKYAEHQQSYGKYPRYW